MTYGETCVFFPLGTSSWRGRKGCMVEKCHLCCTYSQGWPLFSHDDSIGPSAFNLFWPWTCHDLMYYDNECNQVPMNVAFVGRWLRSSGLCLWWIWWVKAWGLLRRTALVLQFSKRSSDQRVANGRSSAAFCVVDPSRPSDTPVADAMLHLCIQHVGILALLVFPGHLSGWRTPWWLPAVPQVWSVCCSCGTALGQSGPCGVQLKMTKGKWN
jgi:hypothetical protein